MKLKTHKAWAIPPDDGDQRCWRYSSSGFALPKSMEQKQVPVLVIPEAAVKDCKHWNHEKLDRYPAGQHLRWCLDCGAFRQSDSEHWQRPRILRAGRQR